jgi:hypothetical protein
VSAWPTAAEMTLNRVRADWMREYDVWPDGGAYYACYTLGGKPIEAKTPEGLHSAIMADAFRRGMR